MNEQLQTTINELLTQSMEALNQGADWLAGEIPEVVSQLLVWNVVLGSLWAAFWIVVIIVYLANAKKIAKKTRSSSGDIESEMGYTMLLAGGGVLSAVGVFSAMHYLEIVLQIIVAPKLYLLEYAADLVK